MYKPQSYFQDQRNMHFDRSVTRYVLVRVTTLYQHMNLDESWYSSKQSRTAHLDELQARELLLHGLYSHH